VTAENLSEDPSHAGPGQSRQDQPLFGDLTQYGPPQGPPRHPDGPPAPGSQPPYAEQPGTGQPPYWGQPGPGHPQGRQPGYPPQGQPPWYPSPHGQPLYRPPRPPRRVSCRRLHGPRRCRHPRRRRGRRPAYPVLVVRRRQRTGLGPAVIRPGKRARPGARRSARRRCGGPRLHRSGGKFRHCSSRLARLSRWWPYSRSVSHS
jgi:hypothetical protein